MIIDGVVNVREWHCWESWMKRDMRNPLETRSGDVRLPLKPHISGSFQCIRKKARWLKRSLLT